jgi:GT2 family glycosyltransferase
MRLRRTSGAVHTRGACEDGRSVRKDRQFDQSPPQAVGVTEPSVAVVVPAYNRAATIRPAIESVLRQSWRDLELIVVDDGSTDGTPEAARAIPDPRLRLIETPRNMGASAARNLGIAATRATWVAFQDSDDEWLPLKLEKQMARLLAPGADHVASYCGMLILDEPHDCANRPAHRLRPRYFPEPEEPTVDGNILHALLRRSLISTQTLVARRDRLLEIGGFDPELPALIDWDCVLRLAPLGSIAFVDEPLVLQRFSSNSITRDRARKLASQIHILKKHAPLFARHPALAARQHYIVAGGHRQAGDISAARAALARARALQPGNPQYWAMELRLAILALTTASRAPSPPHGG